METIGVALCTYNGENYLKAQLDSILQQTVSVNEIVICDDKSSDATIAILESYQAKFPNIIKVFKNDTTLRSVKNFEKAIFLTTSDYIFLSDQDDIWRADKVQKTLQVFNENPTVEGVFSNANFINSKGILLPNDLWKSIYFQNEKVSFSELFKYIVLKRNVVTGATLCVKREVKDYAFPFPEVKLFHHDHWLALLISNQNKLAYCNENLISYRLHDEQQVGSSKKISILKKIKSDFVDAFVLSGKKSFFFKRKIEKTLQNNLKLYQSLQEVATTNQEIIIKAINLVQEKLKN